MPHVQVIKVDTLFIAPGNVIDPMEFSVDPRTIRNGFTKVTVTQKEKVVATTVVRFTKNLVPQMRIDSSDILFPTNVKSPEFYEKIRVDKNEKPGLVGDRNDNTRPKC